MNSQQLYLGLAIVAGILVIVFLLKDRITAFSARYGKGRLDLKASEPEPTRAGVRVQGIEAGRDATIANRAGGGIDAEKVKAGRDAKITNDPPPPK